MSETTDPLAAVVTDDEVTAVALALGRRLQTQGWKIVTAESCTGGLIARALTEIGGSSVWYERGFVTYSDESKCESLAVSATTIEVHGAVSEATAREMAAGALKHSRAQLALSVTGIAGPSGGVPGKPVGTVCFGWATADRVESTTCRFDGDRASVRRRSALFALERANRLLPRPGAPALAA